MPKTILNHPTSFLIISNGYGEDLMAGKIILALQKSQPNCQITPVPLVGPGLEYQKLNLTPALTNPIFPSGGFLRNFKAFWLDAKIGLFRHILHQKKTLKKLSRKTQTTIVVGDVFALVMAAWQNKNPVYFIATAKSDLFMPHSPLEIWLIKKLAKKIFTRDEITAKKLQSKGVAAYFLGNLMLDNFEFSQTAYHFSQEKLTLGLLPGSREEAYSNLVKMLSVIEELELNQPARFQFFVALAPSLDLHHLVTILPPYWRLIKNELKNSQNTNLYIQFTTIFGDFLQHSDLILGLSGTANEQAIYVGHTVIAFPGTGPQTTARRFQEQQKLLGKNLIFLPHSQPTKISSEILKITQNFSKPQINFPQQNAAEKIIQEIIL